MIPIIDQQTEAQVRAFHTGVERAAIRQSARFRDQLARAQDEPRPTYRKPALRAPQLAAWEADELVSSQLWESVMVGAPA